MSGYYVRSSVILKILIRIWTADWTKVCRLDESLQIDKDFKCFELDTAILITKKPGRDLDLNLVPDFLRSLFKISKFSPKYQTIPY